MDSPELEGLKMLQVKARKLLGQACSERRGQLRMCIPARPDEDDDLVIGSALDSIPKLIAEVERYQWQPEWRPVVSHPGQFEVSRTGHVRKCDGTMVGEWLSDQGYVLVRLSGPRTVVRLHRLVADAFIPNANGLPYVNHIDCNRQNNASDNLEWCTQAENVAHSARLGRMDHQEPRRSPNAKLEDEVVSSIRLDSAKGGMSQVQIAKKYGVGKNTVNRIVNRQIYV